MYAMMVSERFAMNGVVNRANLTEVFNWQQVHVMFRCRLKHNLGTKCDIHTILYLVHVVICFQRNKTKQKREERKAWIS